MKKILFILVLLGLVSCAKYSIRQDIYEFADSEKVSGSRIQVQTILLMNRNVGDVRLEYKSIVETSRFELDNVQEKEYYKAMEIYTKIKGVEK